MKRTALFILIILAILGLTSAPNLLRGHGVTTLKRVEKVEKVKSPVRNLPPTMVKGGEVMLEEHNCEMNKLKLETEQLYQQTLELQRLIRRKQSDVREHHP